ncbi:TM2 domain-containing protein [Nocardioides stalactiti]|uniref:TM2 domain-containing protein n=1 Tax=Nocardioides stalactiti TaxID=2755356 RepID=UPI001C7FB58B|nr:TM2 domain-containing protein [Nocardioides stalactiti]
MSDQVPPPEPDPSPSAAPTQLPTPSPTQPPGPGMTPPPAPGMTPPPAPGYPAPPSVPPAPGFAQPPGQAYQPYGTSPPQSGFPISIASSAKVPGQIDPETGLPYSDKERLMAGLLQLLPLMVGVAGVGRLYTGHTAIGIVMLVGTISGWVMTCLLIGLLWAVPIWIWGLVDGILMLTNKRFTDADGRLLR